jgi:4-alpha-glucanotransferase
MKLNLLLNYVSSWGETVFICGNIEALGNNNEEQAIPMHFSDSSSWVSELETANENTEILYYYFVLNNNGTKKYCAHRHLIQTIPEKAVYQIRDTWCTQAEPVTSFFTKPFSEIFSTPSRKNILKPVKGTTHLFKICAPLLKPFETVCITGNIEKLGNWDTEKVNLLKEVADGYAIALQIPVSDSAIRYKYAVYNTKEKKLVYYEEGADRILHYERQHKEMILVHDSILRIGFPEWKGAGVAVPVFSLRTKNSFGVGEFSDIRLLASWCGKTGIKMIQLLPVNDTIVDKSNTDSYPYAANSSFALHPLYINLHETGQLPKDHKLELQYNRKQKKFNKEPVLIYAEVIKFKLAYLKELYLADSGVLQTEAFQEFFEKNKHWLKPYAMYCFLRDKYKTADFSEWGAFAVISAEKISKFTSTHQKQYNSICFWYFVQYHLHLQLSKSVKVVHQLGIALKGDIPIGIGRTSCDAWQFPQLFHMDQQAGAPPDDFAVKGQNWGFPTYNWEQMQKDGFDWWKKRFEKMQDYFDAFRIDHILGFFRIWSIPVHAVEGIMGHFDPAIPVYLHELQQQQLDFDWDRFCKPFLNGNYLEQIFTGDNIQAILDHFFVLNKYGNYDLNENFDTQIKIAAFFKNQTIFDKSVAAKLFTCIANVIFFESEEQDGNSFHFNIAMEKTNSFQQLPWKERETLKKLYIQYFFERQEEFWRTEGSQKLPSIKQATQMLVCGEDLGMVPACVPGVLKNLSILSLEVQRMPKTAGADFIDLNQVPYMSVTTPSTHDMSTIREWWEEDRQLIQKFYNQRLYHFGEAPQYCEPWIAKQIINQHLQCKSMLSIFQLQDLLAISSSLRRKEPREERINIPADPKHYWCYRMHIRLEDLLKEKEFNDTLKTMVSESGR